MNELLSEALKIQNQIRPAPFWSWNGKMEPDILRSQVREMAKAGLGGFFMHARVGINTPYMGEEWYECISACIDEAKKTGISAWGYDENGYPSGIAGGAVCDASEDYRSSWIEFIDIDNLNQLTSLSIIAIYKIFNDNYVRCSFSEINKGCIALVKKNETRAADPLNADAVELFLKLTHEEYYKRYADDFGWSMPGFFTDEPQLKMFQLPWTKDLDKIFLNEYGYDLLDNIFCLRYDLKGKEKVRYDYWKLVNKLYCENFGKKIFDWCGDHHCMFTGHIMGEDTLLEQMASNGGAMPFYEYMDIPGMDWLGRRIAGPLTCKQVSSVAAQLGKRKVISETFALSGWDVSFKELKWMAEWQFANGINMLCPHLQSYSLKGIRKRDYPPSLFVQQNWWDEYSIFNDYISKLGAILSASDEICDLLVLHPLTSAYLLFDGTSACQSIKTLDMSFDSLSKTLAGLHISYQYGDEAIMKKHANVEDGVLKIGEMTYRTILLPDLKNIDSSTYQLLFDFIQSKGKVFYINSLPDFIDGVPDSRVLSLDISRIEKKDFREKLGHQSLQVSLIENDAECEQVLVMPRKYNDTKIIFIVNTDLNVTHNLKCQVYGTEFLSKLNFENMTTEKIVGSAFGGMIETSITLRGGQSILLMSDHTDKMGFVSKKTIDEKSGVFQERANVISDSKRIHMVSIPPNLAIEKTSLNTYTMDRCDFSISGGEWQENIPIILMQRKLLDAQENCNISMRFIFELDQMDLPDSLFLLCENIPEFSLMVNGTRILYTDIGWEIDPCFKKVDITKVVKKGKNEIVLNGLFWQRMELYERLYKDKDLSSSYYACDFDFEAVTYDTELESIYLMGNFCVESKTPCTSGDRRAVFTDGPFVLTKERQNVLYGDITSQGYLFFTGRMTLCFDVDILLEKGARYLLDCKKPNCPVSVVYVNGERAGDITWEPAQIDLTENLHNGTNHISIELISSHRNLLGPHHYIDGECYSVGVSTFSDTPGWCENKTGNIWVDRYCFVNYGFDININ